MHLWRKGFLLPPPPFNGGTRAASSNSKAEDHRSAHGGPWGRIIEEIFAALGAKSTYGFRNALCWVVWSPFLSSASDDA